MTVLNEKTAPEPLVRLIVKTIKDDFKVTRPWCDEVDDLPEDEIVNYVMMRIRGEL